MINLIAAAAIAATVSTIPCEDLTKLELADTTITSAEIIPTGVFVWPDIRQSAFLAEEKYEPKHLTQHCRVTMTLTPTVDSSITVEMWLPESNWNGKLLAVGNGLWAGTVQYYNYMEEALLRGYAVTSSDLGHADRNPYSGMFALNQPQKIIDFAYRAVHLMAIRSKEVVTQHYNDSIDYAYFRGCSTGGRSALMAAQRYPDDFDGIIAMAPANRHLQMHAASVANHVELYRHPEQAIDAATAQFVTQSILQQCDMHQLGFLQNPLQCDFDFTSLLCEKNKDSHCLTSAQLLTVERLYDGVKNNSGATIFPGQPLGNSLSAQPSSDSEPFSLVLDTVRILGHNSANWDWKQFDLDRDVAKIFANAGFVNATNADLSSYKAHGGVLLLIHGWGDLAISANNTINYYHSVQKEMGPQQENWLRLFMVPGMDHCGGGPGVWEFDELSALEQWREQGVTPSTIPATNPLTGISQPLCAHPSFAQYSGDGNVRDARNWRCTVD